MGIFDKLFGKKNEPEQQHQPVQHTHLSAGDKVIGTDNNTLYKITRELSPELSNTLESSPLLLMVTQLYMHYWVDGLVCTDPDDQTWQNQVVFFWKAEEPFPKKSLPPVFETFQSKYFVFTGDTSRISLTVAQAMPWFGMPGLGEKHVCEINGQKISIPELQQLGLVQYVSPITLTEDNQHILTDRDNYFLLADPRMVSFNNGQFYMGNTVVPLSVAYGIGAVHIVKRC